MTRTFDLVVIGSGSAAGTVASRCRAAGWTVAMIDKRPFGGTCALRGCDPKKVLVGGAAAVDAARALAGKGVRPGALAIDWGELNRFKRTFTDPYPEKRKASLAKAGIETVDGVARFVGPAQVAVGDVTLEAKRAILVAAGARPDDLPIAGREHLVTSDDFLDLTSLPSSVAFVGGGYISFEFAHVAARAGARVTILHRGQRPLVEFDPDLIDRLVAATRALGIDVRLGAEVRAVESAGHRFRVRSRDAQGDADVDADLVVHGAGRVPELQLSLRSAPFERVVLDRARSGISNSGIGRDERQVEDRSSRNNGSVEGIAWEVFGKLVCSRRDGGSQLQKVQVLRQPSSKEMLEGAFEP